MGAETSSPDDSLLSVPPTLLESVEVVKFRRDTSDTEDDCRITSDSDMDEVPFTPRNDNNGEQFLSSKSHAIREIKCWGGWLVARAPFAYLQRAPLLTSSPSSSVTSLETAASVQPYEVSIDKQLTLDPRTETNEIVREPRYEDDMHSPQLPSTKMNICAPGKDLRESPSPFPLLPDLQSRCPATRLRCRTEPMTDISSDFTLTNGALPASRVRKLSVGKGQGKSTEALQSRCCTTNENQSRRCSKSDTDWLRHQTPKRTATTSSQAKRRLMPPLPQSRRVQRAASESHMASPSADKPTLTHSGIESKARRQLTPSLSFSSCLFQRADSDPNIRPRRCANSGNLGSLPRLSALQNYFRENSLPQRARRGSANSVYQPFACSLDRNESEDSLTMTGRRSSPATESPESPTCVREATSSRACIGSGDALCHDQPLQNEEAPIVYCYPEDDDPILASPAFCGIMDHQGYLCGMTGPDQLRDHCHQTDQLDRDGDQKSSTLKSSQLFCQREYLFNHAMTLESQGRLLSALESYDECLQLINAGGGTEFDAAAVYHKIGVVSWKKGAYEDSLRVLTLSLDSYQHLLGCSVLDDAMIMNCPHGSGRIFAEILISIGQAFLSLGDHRKAWQHYERSVRILKCLHSSSFDNNDCLFQVLARGFLGLGMVDEATGRYSRSMSYYNEALRLQRSSHGPAHVDIATTLSSIGVVLEKSGQYHDAMDYFSQALCIYRSDLGSSPVDIAVTLTNIGWIHYVWCNFESASQAYSDALRIMKAVLGDEHRNVASIMFHVGLIYVQQGRLSEALSIYKDVLMSQKNALGPEHLDIAITLDSISVAYEHLQQYERAAAFLSRALKMRFNSLGKKHLHVAMTLERLGLIHMKKGDVSTAEMCYLDALRVYSAKKLGSDDSRLQHVRSALREIEMWQQGQMKSVANT